jgi:chromosome segregation ATPase
MSAVKALDIVLRVKRRRIEQAEQHVRQCQQVLMQRQQEREQAFAQAAECRANEQGCADKIDSMCRSAFVSHDLLVMRHVLTDLKAVTKKADAAGQAAQQAEQAAADAVSQARRAVQKAESVVEFLEKRREQLLRDIDYARDELQDEESEEAAVGRMVAAARAATEAAEQAAAALQEPPGMKGGGSHAGTPLRPGDRVGGDSE